MGETPNRPSGDNRSLHVRCPLYQDGSLRVAISLPLVQTVSMESEEGVRKNTASDPSATCFRLLPKVSRTFAIGIDGLKEPLRTSVCVSYLLCRILDTIEDAPGLETAERREMIMPFLTLLRGGKEVGADWLSLVEGKLSPVSSGHDMELIRNTRSVLEALHAAGEPERNAAVRWVTEMGKGMIEWSSRMGEGGLKTLRTMDDLDRYCYYIAGTVGYLLTDLFFILSSHIDRALFFRLQADAESYGLGLQKVNILKDFADDFDRGWCFIPTELLEAKGLTPADLAGSSGRDEIYEALLPLIRSTVKHLDDAWQYLTLVPLEERETRLFLGQSLFFAIETLTLAAKDPGRLTSKKKLKISRFQVAGTMTSLERFISNPERLAQYHSSRTSALDAFARG